MTWVTKPEPITKGKGENVTFVCKGEGRPTPELPKWSKNSERILGNYRRTVSASLLLRYRKHEYSYSLLLISSV